MSELELKPCPFCGGKAMLLTSKKDCVSYITCTGCSCQTPKIQYAAEYCANDRVAETWNKRVQDYKLKTIGTTVVDSAISQSFELECCDCVLCNKCKYTNKREEGLDFAEKVLRYCGCARTLLDYLKAR